MLQFLRNFRRGSGVSLVLLALACPLFASTGRAADLVVTQYKVSMCSVPYLLAMYDKDFQKAGLNIDGIITAGGGGSVLRNVFASPLPYGEVAVSAVLAAKRQGLDVVIVNSGIRSGGEASLVARRDSGIKTLKDLVGKKVAITTARSLSEVTLLMALEREGISPDSVTRVSAGGYGQGLTMLDQNAVAAASLLIPLSIINKDKYHTVFSNDLLPPYMGTVGVTTRAFASANPDVIRKIIAVRRAALQRYAADPYKYTDKLAADYNLDPRIMKESIETERRFNLVSDGRIDRGELERIASGLMMVGELKEPVKWDELIDESFLPDDLRSKK